MVIAELYVWTLGFLALLNLGLCVYAWMNLQAPGAFVCGLAALAVAQVCLMYQLLTTAPDSDLGFIYARLRFIGLSAVNPLLLIFILQYTQQRRWLRPSFVAALFIVPLITQYVLWFTPAREQFFGGWTLVPLGHFQLEQRSFTGWYFVHALYSSLLILVSLAALVWYTRHVDSTRRRELYGFLALIIIAAYGVTTTSTLGPQPGLKLAPLALGMTSLGIGWLLLGGNLGRVMPVAYDLIFSSIHDAVLVLDLHDLIVKVNPAAERVFQRPASTMLDKAVADVMAELPGWKDHAAEAAFEVTGSSTDRAKRYEVQNLPLTRGLQPVGRLIVLRDVTARYEAMALSLERQRSHIINSFIADASHEFRTPLSVIKSSAYLLGRQTGGPTGARHVVQINEYADRINALVDDLQMIASLDSGQPLGHEPVEVSELLSSVVDEFGRPQSALKNQTLTLSIDAALPMLRGNNDELLLALQKILHNAVRYTPTGGSIRITATALDAGVRITVADSGIGMDEQTAQAAPQRFYRLDTARTTSGFGLGLSIAQRIVERQGGTLSIASTPGDGTTVTITLPQNWS